MGPVLGEGRSLGIPGRRVTRVGLSRPGPRGHSRKLPPPDVEGHAVRLRLRLQTLMIAVAVAAVVLGLVVHILRAKL
jgi:hypothetical protein